MVPKPADLLEIAQQLDNVSTKLKLYAQQLTADPSTAVERDAILDLSDTNRELLSYVLTQGGRVSYEKATKDLKLTSKMIGGRMSVFTRKATHTNAEPILSYEGSDKDGWEIVLDKRYLDAAWEIELAQ